MSYTYINFAQCKSQLASRLGDANKVFWTDEELGIYITEALRTYGLCSGFWRARGTVTASPSLAFYDLNTLLYDGAEYILSPTITDRDIIKQLQYMLLESTASQSSWSGTAMFTYNDLANAVQNALNQFLSDTGIVVNRTMLSVSSPPAGRQELAQSVIDVRRAAWLGASPFNYYTPLWREDERMLAAAQRTWTVDSDTPSAFSIMSPPPLQIQIAPPPIASGELELLTVDSTTLTPASTATILNIPNDLTPAIKWRALSTLLSIDGIARDPVRAVFCEERYRQYVELARMLPVVLNAEINGIALIPCTLQEIESSDPMWENKLDTPQDIALVSANMIAVNPPPDNIYSFVLDVVRKTPVPTNDGAFIQIGREQLDAILDYAEHLALFKVAGAEWHATQLNADNFLLQSVTYNQRIAAAARAVFSASEQSQKQKQEIPRRSNRTMVGTGALKNIKDTSNARR